MIGLYTKVGMYFGVDLGYNLVMMMKREIAMTVITPKALLKRVAEETGLDLHIRSYSGRAMYGDTCLAVTSDERGIEWTLGIAIGRMMEAIEREHEDGDEDELSPECHRFENDVRIDSMGRGVVVYWPSVKWEADTDEEEEEDDED